MSWYVEALRKYAVFGGRARRKEYWYFFLFNMIIGMLFTLIDSATGGNSGKSISIIGILNIIYSFAVLIPGLAVTVRRLHDTGRSGWWILLSIIPIIGGIILLIYMVQDSKPGENEYGQNPKECHSIVV